MALPTLPVIEKVSTVAAPTPRVVTVPDANLPLLRRAGLVPPDSGPYDPAELDARLAEGPLSTSEKFQVKTVLMNAGLLSPGRPVSTTV
jgi:hypothetical protein